jgi:undecaprenyl-diphosphatase
LKLKQNVGVSLFEQTLKAILLGVVQGLTEWLPVSSTGHLKILEHLFSLDVPMLFDITLHFGTLIVVLTFFRKDIKLVLKALANMDFKTEHGRLIPLIIVGTVPTAVIGWFFSEFLIDVLQNLSIIAIAFMACGVFLYIAKTRIGEINTIGFREAFLIGVAQGFAVVPGLSRSGLTISTALLLGIKREKAFRFSFLLSVPTIMGALALTLHREFSILAASNMGFAEVAVGTFTASFVGFLALKLLWKVLAKGKLHIFAFYCWALGLTVLLALFFGVF